MKKLVIIGAGGFGRCIYNYALESSAYQSEWVIKGFIDDNLDALNGFEGYPSIIGTVKDYSPEEEDVFFCALGYIKTRKPIIERLLFLKVVFINIIHPTSIIAPTVKLGIGILVAPFVTIQADATVSDFVTIQTRTNIGHDVVIGEHSQLFVNSFFGGGARVGECVTVFTGGIILPRVKVGDGATIGAGAVCMRDVKVSSTVFGNPAKKL